MKLSIRQIAKQENTSVKSVYRWLADGLEYYDLIGGIKVEEADLQDYLGRKKKCQSGKTLKGDTTLPSSEGEQEFIERARQRSHGGRRSRRNPISSSVSSLPNQERS